MSTSISPTIKETKMAETHNVLLLADSIQKMRDLLKDERLNILMQDKKYMELAEKMAEINRAANICSGIYFNMWIQQANIKEDGDKILNVIATQNIDQGDKDAKIP